MFTIYVAMHDFLANEGTECLGPLVDVASAKRTLMARIGCPDVAFDADGSKFVPGYLLASMVSVEASRHVRFVGKVALHNVLGSSNYQDPACSLDLLHPADASTNAKLRFVFICW